MIWYSIRRGDILIKEVDVIKETPKTVTIQYNPEYRVTYRKDNLKETFFRTKKEAYEKGIQFLEEDITSIKSKVQYFKNKKKKFMERYPEFSSEYKEEKKINAFDLLRHFIPEGGGREILGKIQEALQHCKDELYSAHGIFGDRDNAREHSYALKLASEVIPED